MKYFLSKKNCFDITNLNLIALFFLTFLPTHSFAAVSTAIGTVTAQSAEGTIDTNAIKNADLIYEDLYVTDYRGDNDSFAVSKGIKEGTVYKEKTLYFTAKPNTFVSIAYGNQALSKKDNQDNLNGYAVVVLKNRLGNTMIAKIKIDSLGIFFDKDGKAELKVASEFSIAKGQPKGTYRGYYHMVISY